MNATTRVVVEAKPNSGAWNMAIDEAMLEAAVERNECYLRFYRWKEATVSLGYFQKPDEMKSDPLLGNLPVVKRLSGGGAILHEHEWTYSCSVPASHLLSRHPVKLYDRIHRSIIDAFYDVDVVAKLREEVGDNGDDATLQIKPSDEPFLCFGRGDPRDIVIDDQKILGSAQRRRRGAILQHGSLLLETSKHAPQFAGLKELSQLDDIDGFVINRLIPAVSHLFAPTTQHVEFVSEIIQRATELAEQRYGDTQWRAN